MQKEKVRRHFGQTAQSYSRGRGESYSFDAQRRAVLRMLEGVKGRVVDVGCGGGYLLPDLRRLSLEVYGLDIAPAMLAIARARMEGQGSHLLVGDIEHLPFAPGHFDAAVSMGVMEYLSTPAPALGQLHRVLKPGGRLIISVPSGTSPHVLVHRAFSRIHRALRALLGRSAKKPLYEVRPVIPRRFDQLIEEGGFRKVAAEHCNFIFYPVDQLLPGLSVALSRRLEGLSRSKRWGWLGRQYIVMAVKATPEAGR